MQNKCLRFQGVKTIEVVDYVVKTVAFWTASVVEVVVIFKITNKILYIFGICNSFHDGNSLAINERKHLLEMDSSYP